MAAGLALVMVALVWATSPRTTAPPAVQERGASFFPGFTDPGMVRSLEVVDFDEDTATAHPFKVRVQDGAWTIPSHYDYPVDGMEHLARTAAAIIALKKDNVATENVSEHERTGTLDPLDETLPILRGRGTRVIVQGEHNRNLADIIIGRQLADRPTFRYVRLAGQPRVYVAAAGDLRLSTRFTDWIDSDLLKIEWADVDQMIVRDYSVDKATGRLDVRDVVFLQKLGEDDQGRVRWTLRGLPPGEQVDTFRANLLNTALDELSIVAVRPKPSGLAAGFAQLTGTLKVSRDDLADLASKGFHFTPKGELFSDEGELLVHTKSGVFFRLWFGGAAYGDEERTAPAADVVASGSSRTPREGESTPGAVPEPLARLGLKPFTAPSETAVDKKASTRAPIVNRYVMVSVSFDPSAAAADTDRTAAQERVAALQNRFAPWYYTISGASFEDLHMSRRTVVRKGP
jgi:hypothetical protein